MKLEIFLPKKSRSFHFSWKRKATATLGTSIFSHAAVSWSWELTYVCSLNCQLLPHFPQISLQMGLFICNTSLVCNLICSDCVHLQHQSGLQPDCLILRQWPYKVTCRLKRSGFFSDSLITKESSSSVSLPSHLIKSPLRMAAVWRLIGNLHIS